MSWSWEVHSLPSRIDPSVGTKVVKGSSPDKQDDLKNWVEASGSPAIGFFLYNTQKP